jgi:hypothetical protein
MVVDTRAPIRAWAGEEKAAMVATVQADLAKVPA